MPLETPTYINDLVPGNPSDTDNSKQGAGHLRAIKLALKNTFANVTGPIVASHTQINAAAASVGAALSSTGRNRIHNGAFTVNQRAVSGTVNLPAGSYGHDRWKAGASGCTYTFSGAPPFYGLTILSGSLVQLVEGGTIEGGNYTLSWQGTATGRVSGQPFAASGVTALSIPAGTQLSVEFGTGSLSQVQLEPGLIATPYELRGPREVLQDCQRFFEVLDYTIDAGPTTDGVARAFWVFKVTKRTTPFIALQSGSLTAAQQASQGALYAFNGGSNLCRIAAGSSVTADL